MSSAALRQRLVGIAVGEVGLKEYPGHPNVGPDVTKYQQATWLAPGPWPWCSALVCWVIQQWLKDPDVLRHLGMSPAMADRWRPKTARAFDLDTVWAAKNKLQVLPPTALALAGDLLVYKFSHVGIVAHDEVQGQPLEALEGNTSSGTVQAGAAAQRDGDGVWRRHRVESLVRSYVRIMP